MGGLVLFVILGWLRSRLRDVTLVGNGTGSGWGGFALAAVLIVFLLGVVGRLLGMGPRTPQDKQKQARLRTSVRRPAESGGKSRWIGSSREDHSEDGGGEW